MKTHFFKASYLLRLLVRPYRYVPKVSIAIFISLSLINCGDADENSKVQEPEGDDFTVLYRISHQSHPYKIAYGPDLGSSKDLYVFEDTRGSKDGVHVWDYEHITGGGWNGTNCVEYSRWEDVDGALPAGWFWSDQETKPAQGWGDGPYYARWRMKVIKPLTLGADNAAQMKFLIFGGPGLDDGNDRMIMFLERADFAGGNDNTHITIRLSAGISKDYATVLVPVGEWAHIQIGWLYGPEGVAYQRIWLNNNDKANPNSENTEFNDQVFPPGVWDAPGEAGMLEGRWGGQVASNSYTGTDAVFRLQDYELADGFDSNWYPD